MRKPSNSDFVHKRQPQRPAQAQWQARKAADNHKAAVAVRIAVVAARKAAVVGRMAAAAVARMEAAAAAPPAAVARLPAGMAVTSLEKSFLSKRLTSVPSPYGL